MKCVQCSHVYINLPPGSIERCCAIKAFSQKTTNDKKQLSTGIQILLQHTNYTFRQFDRWWSAVNGGNSLTDSAVDIQCEFQKLFRIGNRVNLSRIKVQYGVMKAI